MPLGTLKQMRLLNARFKAIVDRYLSRSAIKSKIRLEITDIYFARLFFNTGTTIPHSCLVLDLPLEDDMRCFFTLDMKRYVEHHAKDITRIKMNWCSALSDTRELQFLTNFNNLKRLGIYNIPELTEFEFPDSNRVDVFLRLKSLYTVWSPAYSVLGIFQNSLFRPEKLKFTDVSTNEAIRFLSDVSDHLKLRSNTTQNLKSIYLDDLYFQHDLTFPSKVLIRFAEGVIENNCLVKGLTLPFLNQLHSVVDRKTFLCFLESLKTVHGFHPLMKNAHLTNLKDIEIDERPLKPDFLDLDNTFRAVGSLPKLKNMSIKIAIPNFDATVNRKAELLMAECLLVAVLDNVCPVLKSLTLEIQKPMWYPLRFSITDYLGNYTNLQDIQISMELNSNETKELFRFLLNTNVTKICLRNCLATDDSFSVDCDDPSFFMKLSGRVRIGLD